MKVKEWWDALPNTDTFLKSLQRGRQDEMRSHSDVFSLLRSPLCDVVACFKNGQHGSSGSFGEIARNHDHISLHTDAFRRVAKKTE